MFLLNAWKIPRNIDKIYQRDIEGIAKPDKTSRLVRTVYIQAACQDTGLIADDANG